MHCLEESSGEFIISYKVPSSANVLQAELGFALI